MHTAYRQYLELFDYFGRGGMRRLKQAEFLPLHEEFERLLALGPDWTPEQVARIVDLRSVLLRERPSLRELKQAVRK